MKRNVDRWNAAGGRRRRALAGLVIAVLFAVSAAPVLGESASTDYKRGQDAEAGQDFDAALAWYQKAFKREPTNVSYQVAVDRIRTSDSTMHLTKGRQLLAAGNAQEALTEFLRAAEVDPGNEAAQQEIARMRSRQSETSPIAETAIPEPASELSELNEIGGPVMLKAVSNVPLTLHMNEDAKVIYQAIGKAAGINVLFDPDYNAKRIQVDLNGVTLLDALRIVGAMSNTFWKPVTANTIFVAQNTRVKRAELETQAVQTFYLTNAWQQNDLNDVQTALRNVLPNAKVYGVASQNAIVMRATPDELLLAAKLINDLDKPRPEVVVDFGVLEVSKNWERTLGLDWPSSIGVQLLPPTSSSSSTTTTSTSSTSDCTENSSGQCLTLSNLANLNSNDFAITVSSATLNMLLSNSNTQILQDPRIRATDGQKATLTIGSKIPIATGSYTAAGTVSSAYAQTQFQYIDVGVKIEMTPTVHYDDDVTLKVHVEVSSESGTETIEDVTEPILSQRVIDQVIRLREGEASILGGIQDNETETSWSGIPGLSSIPILKYLFGSKDHTTKDDEIVFVVIPHVVRSPSIDAENLRVIDTGAGQSIELRHLNPPVAGAGAPAKPVTPATSMRSGQGAVGTVSATSASAAAMQALTQMHNENATMTQPGASPPASPPPAGNAAAGSGAVSFSLVAPQGPVQAGSSFQVPILIKNGSDVSSVPLQLHYDPARLTLVNVTGGDFLSKDGQAMALIHRDDGPGNVTVVASRPPGSAGVNGSGTVCVLSFQAKTAGATTLTMTRAGIMNSKQQQVPAQPSQAELVVR